MLSEPTNTYRGSVTGSGPSQSEYRSSLRWRCNRPIELLGDADDALDQLCIALRELASSIVDVILEPDTNVTAEENSQRRKRKRVATEVERVEPRAVWQIRYRIEEIPGAWYRWRLYQNE
jgi:hypothetical protein